MLATHASSPNDNPSSKPPANCAVCNGYHAVPQCFKFKAMSLENRRQVVSESRLCFGCLKKGHRSKFCKNRATCANCGKRHPTLLHDNSRSNDQSRQETGQSNNSTNTTTSSISCCTVQNGSSTSMIVPVWVSTYENPSCEILTYALLDTQSDSSFIVGHVA